MSNVPEDLKYTASHEWVQLLDDGTVKVGITDHAQDQLGDMVYVESPVIGQTYAAGAECAVVESVKSASDLYCPVTGEVVEFNESLTDAPETLNRDPYGEGWIFRLKPQDAAALDDLLDADGYKEVVEATEG